jgi:hypothetical protein
LKGFCRVFESLDHLLKTGMEDKEDTDCRYEDICRFAGFKGKVVAGLNRIMLYEQI